jgi:hypothetical protein
MAGRKPKPTALKKLEGNPGKRKLNMKEPVPGKGISDCSKWLLPEAKEEWKRLCQKLSEMGVLTEIDMAAFAASEFGLTPTLCIEENVTRAEKGCFGTDKSTVFSVLTNNA